MTAVPLLGDISLPNVQRIEHRFDGGFERIRVASLPGELLQRVGRPSHVITLSGVITGDSAADDLAALQKAAAAGDEQTFAADITTALELNKVVITWFRAVALAGEPGRYAYELVVTESPPLPPPAEVEAFGGLGDFGLGDLGFDTDVLGDLAAVAGDIADAAEAAMDVLGQLDALSGLADLNLDGLLGPMNEQLETVTGLASTFRDAARVLGAGLS